jgi:hypothetical protein
VVVGEAEEKISGWGRTNFCEVVIRKLSAFGTKLTSDETSAVGPGRQSVEEDGIRANLVPTE